MKLPQDSYDAPFKIGATQLLQEEEGCGTLYERFISAAEKPLLEMVWARTGGNQVHAAVMLGINRNTFRKKMGKYKMTGKIPRTWAEYDTEVQKLEAEGLTTSDAQAEVDARMMTAGVSQNTLMMAELRKTKKKNS